VAVVGRTGSGKTTLAHLLMGLYEPATGEIRYDDTALAGLDYRSLRAQLGVVPQEIELFAGTVYANIALSDSAADEPAVRRAAELAAAHADISRLPSGYLTQIAEGGAGLPGGLRQRIALARALLRQPAILVLDEATSHLDLLTEQTVDQNLRALACTRIAITHRLSSVRHADLILVLDNGALVEQGRHDELMVRGGLYAALARSQPHADEVAL
jgi:ABC-type bacteriocin/lantibiotic exporter with double-glycine peptidase domain